MFDHCYQLRNESTTCRFRVGVVPSQTSPISSGPRPSPIQVRPATAAAQLAMASSLEPLVTRWRLPVGTQPRSALLYPTRIAKMPSLPPLRSPRVIFLSLVAAAALLVVVQHSQDRSAFERWSLKGSPTSWSAGANQVRPIPSAHKEAERVSSRVGTLLSIKY